MFPSQRTSARVSTRTSGHVSARAVARTALRSGAALIALAALNACSSLTDSLSPGRPASEAPARLALSASLPRMQNSQARPMTLGVDAYYLRRDAEPALLSSQQIPLTAEATQQIPISIELAVCLADQQRTTAFTEPRSCEVLLEISLIDAGRVLDVAQVGPVPLQPGRTITAVQPVRLFEIASVFLSEAPGTTPLSETIDTLVAGGTLALQANARDASGGVVGDREIAWTSSNSAVASVAASGVVSAVAPGSARVTATVGGRSASLDVVVLPPVQRLTVVGVPGSGGGRVVSSPSGIDCTLNGSTTSGTCAFDFDAGTSVALTASTAQGAARFGGWTGACLSFGSAPTCTLVMTEPRTAGAGFTALSPITVQSTGSDIRISSGSTVGISCTFTNGVGAGSCSAPFPVGSTVVLDRSHLGVVRVLGFTGCDASTTNACTINVGSAARTITVNTRAGGVLQVSPSGTGGGRISATGANAGALADINCELESGTVSGSCSGAYPGDTLVTVSAVADERSRFVSWSGGSCSGQTSSTCVVPVPVGGVASVEAEFALDVAPITLNLVGSGGGRVRANGNVVCELSSSQTSRQCEFEAPLGQSIELSGEPAGTGAFLGFSGACSSSGAPTCTLAVTSSASVTASFSAIAPTGEVRISSVIAADAIGRVVTSNGDIACDVISGSTSGDCMQEYTYGTSVTLQAQDIANLGLFRRWGATSPCPGSTSLTCTFTVSSASITAAVEYRRPAQIELFIDVDGGPNPTLNVAISVNGFRALDACTYVPQGGSLQCNWTVPMGLPSSVPITLDATTAAGYEVFPFYFPCSWSGTLTRQTCTFSLQGDISGDVLAYPQISNPVRIP